MVVVGGMPVGGEGGHRGRGRGVPLCGGIELRIRALDVHVVVDVGVQYEVGEILPLTERRDGELKISFITNNLRNGA